MRVKFFLKSFLLFFLCGGIAFAQKSDKKMDHGEDHQQIFHAFRVEADIGEMRDFSSKAFELSGFVGGDYDRLWINSEKKNYGDYEEIFEAQALYSRNIDQFWDAQIGVAHDFSIDFTKANVNYFVVGLEGLAPQFFETKAQILLSEKGNYSARFKQEVDIFLTQRLITRPYFTTEISALDDLKLEVKSGISNFEIGVATRYEITRKFAPYFALRYHTKTFGTADLAKQLVKKIDNFIVTIGVEFNL